MVGNGVRGTVIGLVVCVTAVGADRAYGADVGAVRGQESAGHGTTTITRALSFVAAHGEANRLQVTYSGATIVFHDAGAPLRAGLECTQVDAATASCPVFGANASDRGITVDLGDGDDTVVADGSDSPSSGLQLSGGAGGDTLTTRRGSGFLYGGDGDDTLEAGAGTQMLSGDAGNDVVRGGAGDDVLDDTRAAAQDSDTLDGGEGRDRVEYTGRPGFVVDLGAGFARGGAEADRLTGVEDVLVVGNRVTARGDGGPNLLVAHGRDTTLVGRGGADQLDAGNADTGAGGVLDGGPGNDVLSLNPFSLGRETVRCGSGHDFVGGMSMNRFRRDCEVAGSAASAGVLGVDALVALARQPIRLVDGRLTGFRRPCRCPVLIDVGRGARVFVPSGDGVNGVDGSQARILRRVGRVHARRAAKGTALSVPIDAAALASLRRTGHLRLFVLMESDEGAIGLRLELRRSGRAT
ncbi:MAG: serralysin [Solirubrobacteraceae bacterium]|jgi:Ca2+-binding RTX toxin-like protein|nr:serralysin [Solirubrobacteraceae bacterium]